MPGEPSSQRPIIEVAAAVIRDSKGRLLLSQRPEGKHLAGLWEFPGGKRESGESAHAALARELDEELGIEVADSRPLLSLTHHYPEKSVRLLIRTVDDFSGSAVGREGQRIDWFDPAAARELSMPAADRPILQLLQLDPRLAMIPMPTPATPIDFLLDSLIADWQARLDAGFRLLCLPCAGLQDEHLEPVVERCAALARQAGARWLIDGRPDLARRLGADGVHLDSGALDQYSDRPVDAELILAVTCRDDDGLQHAARLAADFACLAPVRQGSAIDWPGFATRVAVSPVPVVALGVAVADLDRARELGAFGVAVTQDFDQKEAPG